MVVGGGGVEIRTENLKFCHVTAAQSGDNPAATLKANLIERKPTRLLEVFDIFRLKKVTCATTRCQRRRGADCCAHTCLWGLTKVHGATRERARSHYSLSPSPSNKLLKTAVRVEVWRCITRLRRRGQSHLPQKSRDTFQIYGLMSSTLDCHPRAEGAAAGLVLPHHGWGCLTAQKPTQH